MKILQLIDALDYSGSAQQLRLLGPALTQDGLTVEICCLGPSSPWVDALRQRGVTVHVLNWTRWFEPSVLWHLRQIVRRSAPQVIHVWRRPALRALATVAADLLPRVVMSAPLPSQGRLNWWDRCLLQRVGLLAVAGAGDQQRCAQEGLAAPLRIVPPAVSSEASLSSANPTQRIVCVGNLERAEGFHLAIWAFDIVRQLYAEAELLLVGAGSQQADLQALSQGLESTQQVHFLGEQTDIAALLHTAAVVWIPSTANCGRQVALEAMALGRVVIASNVACLREVILAGETGYLAQPGEVVPFARHTHELFRDPELRQRLGQAARRHALQHFSLGDATQRWQEAYRSVAA